MRAAKPGDLVALLRALDPDLEPGAIRDLLVESGEPSPICTTDARPCAPQSQETWPILNAGEAVSSLLWSSVNAEIRLPADHVVEGSVNDRVELTVPVVNIGSENWEFYLSGEALLETDDRSAAIQLGVSQNVVDAGESHPFRLEFHGDRPGEWELELKLYRNPELTSSPDSATLTVRLRPDTETAQARQPTAASTPRSFVSISRGTHTHVGLGTTVQ